jgi:hypothetical protein
MDWGQIKTQAVWAALLALATTALGWMLALNQNGTAMAKTDKLEARVIVLEAESARHPAERKAARDFAQCVHDALDRVNNGIKKDATCVLDMPE